MEDKKPAPEEENKQNRFRLLSTLAESLLQKRDEAIQYRSASGIERQWREDEIAFDGMDGNKRSMLDYAQGIATRTSKKEATRSKVLINIIRGRCETAEGRFCDIQLPTDDKNYGLKTTPAPELVDQMRDPRPAIQNGRPITDKSGNQATMADVARDIKDRANKAMSKMETLIDDQLTECDYNGEQRKMIRQAIRLGTGVMKGPNVVKNTKKAWTLQKNEDGSSDYVINTQEIYQPESNWVDVWNIYPSPGTTENVHKTAQYIWEKDEILPRDVRNLVGVPGYFNDQLMLALSEEPKRTRATYDDKRGNYITRTTTERGSSLEKWEGYVDLSRDDLESLGCDCSHDEINRNLAAVVVFINDRIVKVELNTLDTGDIPYDFFQWTQVNSEEPWGIGIPRMLIWLQRVITAAWRAMMDNAGDSAGAMVVVSKSLRPMDGRWEISGKKLFINDDDMEDANKAFAMFQITNNQSQMQAIIELALRFVDLETSLPTIFQGEAQEIPETLGATNIMVDSSNVGMRHRVKLYDDRITRPHIERYYNFNMMYSKDRYIKGDFNVDPRGVSVLLEKDQQAQLLLQTFQLKGDPHIKRIVDWDKAGKLFFTSRRLDILKTEDQLQEYDTKQTEAPQVMEPQIEAAKIRVEGDIKKEEMRQIAETETLRFKAEQAQLDREYRIEMKKMEHEIAMMRLSQEAGIELDKIKVQLALSGAGMNLQEKLADKKATPEVVKPPTEPAGKAPVGQSFER